MSNAVIVIPSNIELPARLRGADIAAQIAAENAAAAGGIKAGGFPRVSIKANKFHIVDGGEMTTLTRAAEPGQPPLPIMCLEVVVIASNPALSKTYYEGEFVEGQADAPDCQSANGVTPDGFVAAPQHSNCASCPQNAWGSAISKFSGKEIKKCGDSKQLVVLPAGDLNFKALGWAIQKGSLTNWGGYVKALTGRNFPVQQIVTNVVFDATANGVLQFSFNRFLTDEEYARVQERAKGDDVKNIVSPAVFVPPPAQLAAPAAAPALAAPAPAPAPAPAAPVTSPSIAAAGAAFAAGATPPAAAPAAEEPPKRTRAKRTPPAPVAGDLSHIPAPIQAALAALPADSPARAALLAQYPAPAAADPFAGQPPHVKMAVDAVGGLGSEAGKTMFATLTGQPIAAAPTPTPAPQVPVAPAVAPVAPVAVAPAAPAPNFGATPPAETAPTPAVTASGASLKDRLQKILQGNGAATGAPAGTTVQ